MHHPPSTTVQLQGTFFDRDGTIPLHFWAHRLQDTRMPWIGELRAAVGDTQPIVVRSQALHVDPAVRLDLFKAQDCVVRVDARIGQVGTSSFEFVADMYLARGAEPARPYGRSIVVLVMTQPDRARPGKVPAPLTAMHDGAPHELRPLLGELRQGLRGAATELARDSPRVYWHAITIRYSDEDTFRHTNQSSYVRFFYEAMSALRHDAASSSAHAELAAHVARHRWPTIAVEYLREAQVGRGGPHFAVIEWPDARSPRLDLYFVGAEAVHSRGRVWPSAPHGPARL